MARLGEPTFAAGPGNAHRIYGQAIVFDGDRDSVLAANAVQLISDYTTCELLDTSRWTKNLQDAEAYVLDF